MLVHPGMLAPRFRTADIFGNPIDLAAYRGTPLLLSFLRNAACAICNLRVHHMIERYATWQRAGIEVVAVFELPAASMVAYVGRQDAPFPLVADPAADLYTVYGVESSEAKIQATMAMPATQRVIGEAAARGFALTAEPGSNFERMPADFVIGPDGVVLEAHYAAYVWDHLPFARLEDVLGVALPS